VHLYAHTFLLHVITYVSIGLCMYASKYLFDEHLMCRLL